MKILKYSELNENLSYDEAKYKYEFSDAIKNYFLEKYTSDFRLLGRYGHAITKNACKNILKFAKHKNDKHLISLVQRHIDRLNLNDEEIEANYKIYRDAKKYNIF